MQEGIKAGRRIVLVCWKGEHGSIEVFSSLKNFCLSYSQYNYHTLTNYLSKNKIAYENDTLKIQRVSLFTSPKPKQPNIYKGLFGDFDCDKINWLQSYRTVIERVLERGTKEEWQELIRFYGKEQIVNALKYEIKYLPDFAIENVCKYFKLKKEELACYTRMQSRKEHWL